MECIAPEHCSRAAECAGTDVSPVAGRSLCVKKRSHPQNKTKHERTHTYSPVIMRCTSVPVRISVKCTAAGADSLYQYIPNTHAPIHSHKHTHTHTNTHRSQWICSRSAMRKHFANAAEPERDCGPVSTSDSEKVSFYYRANNNRRPTGSGWGMW